MIIVMHILHLIFTEYISPITMFQQIGARVVVMPDIDPESFWCALRAETRPITGFYASPTIHQAILQEYKKLVGHKHESSFESIRDTQETKGIISSVSDRSQTDLVPTHAVVVHSDGGSVASDALIQAQAGKSPGHTESSSGTCVGVGVKCQSMRFVASASSPISVEVVKGLASVFPHASILPCYGMTECMPISCPPVELQVSRKLQEKLQPHGSVSTGEVITGVHVIIVDTDFDPVPSQKIGQILVRGDSCFRGYEILPSHADSLHPEARRSLDRKCFVRMKGHEWFMTGDLGLIDESGQLHVRGTKIYC
jgi:acyl-CoA synthetase (AMP-forming)/AMP-acid ligase II